MAFNIYNKIHKQRKYFDKTMYSSYEAWVEQVRLSKTVYVGNLSVYTTDREIYEHMSKVGSVETIIMGLHRVEKTPCGFCFVVYKSKKSSVMAVNILNETILDGRVIKVDEDSGIIGERRYGRGITGVQKIDERLRRFDFDRPVVIENLIPTDSFNDKNDFDRSSHNINFDSQKPLYHIKINSNQNSIYDIENYKGDYKNNRNDTRDNNTNTNTKIINYNNSSGIIDNVFTKHQGNYNTNIIFNSQDKEDSADEKHAKFKAVQRGNRLRANAADNVTANATDNVDANADANTNMYEKNKENEEAGGEDSSYKLNKQIPESINKLKNEETNYDNTNLDCTLGSDGNELNIKSKQANVLYPNAKYKEIVESGKNQNEKSKQEQEK